MSNDSSIPTNPSSPSPHLGPAWSCPQCARQNPPSNGAVIRCLHCAWTPAPPQPARKATPLQKNTFKFWLLFLVPARLVLAHQSWTLPGGHCSGGFKLMAIAALMATFPVGLILCADNAKAPLKMNIPMFTTEIMSLFAFVAML